MLQAIIGNNTPGTLEPPDNKSAIQYTQANDVVKNDIVNECPYRPWPGYK